VKTKANHPKNPSINQNTNPVISTYYDLVHLKHLYRQGWLEHEIPQDRCESVAEHTFGVALISMIVADLYFPELDLQKVLRMALIHDLGEVYAGDIIPKSRIKAEHKHQREKESLCQVLGELPQVEYYLELWEEYETGKSPEARFVRQIDKLEMALQAQIYERQTQRDLKDFYISAEKNINNPKLNDILQELKTLN
jgi:putative hydrolase of HD superfamily